MSRYLLPLLAVSCLVSSCDAPPESYFGRAVLNCNMLHGFAGGGMESQLRQPSMKLVDEDSKEVRQMTRKEVIDDKIAFAEDAYGKVKALRENDDNREMIRASLAVHEYVLPVYRNEYRELAKLYDDGAAPEEIGKLSAEIRDNYGEGFRSRMDALVTAAKPYAERHNLKVNWNVGTAPGG